MVKTAISFDNCAWPVSSRRYPLCRASSSWRGWIWQEERAHYLSLIRNRHFCGIFSKLNYYYTHESSNLAVDEQIQSISGHLIFVTDMKQNRVKSVQIRIEQTKPHMPGPWANPDDPSLPVPAKLVPSM